MEEKQHCFIYNHYGFIINIRAAYLHVDALNDSSAITVNNEP